MLFDAVVNVLILSLGLNLRAFIYAFTVVFTRFSENAVSCHTCEPLLLVNLPRSPSTPRSRSKAVNFLLPCPAQLRDDKEGDWSGVLGESSPQRSQDMRPAVRLRAVL